MLLIVGGLKTYFNLNKQKKKFKVDEAATGLVNIPNNVGTM